MTVETTLQKMFDQWPELFLTRRECYNHLFCTIGNGYEWKRGQLVECDTGDDAETVAMEEADYAVGHPKARQSQKNIDKTLLQRKIWMDAGFATEDDYEHNWYPICEYSKIKRVPIDVKPDWSEALVECKMMMEQDGIDVKIEYTDNES